MKYLLDTCVLSELVRPRPHRRALAWMERRAEEQLAMSVLTIGELVKGLEKLPASPRRTRIEAWVRNDLPARFSGRLLSVTDEVARTWGALAGRAEVRGEPLPVIDGLIAATALSHGLVVVTRNVTDLERCGAAVHDPWSGQ